jgi:hypothetical protein
MTPILSILTPSIPERFDKWLQISQELFLQCTTINATHPTLGRVQLLSDTSDSFLSGGLSIGKKRQRLVEQAKGKYLCFLDDDEDIAPNYVETLVRLCHQDKDVVTFRSFAKNDFYWSVIDMRLGNPNEEATPDRIVKRNAWHICPVKSEYAKLYPFEDTNYSEDWNWMEKVLTHCKTEAHTDQILHCYQHSAKTSEADKITKHVQSKS